MEWVLFPQTYAMLLIGINIVALVNVLWSKSAINFIACLYESVWLLVALSIWEFFVASFVPSTGTCTNHYFFSSVFILRKLQLQITHNCISSTGATEGIRVSSSTASENVLPVLKMLMMGQVMTCNDVLHSVVGFFCCCLVSFFFLFVFFRRNVFSEN